MNRRRRTFIIIDAIEEASNSEEVVELLLSLAEKRLDSLHLLLSSRLEVNIRPALTSIVHVAVGIGAQHSEEDIPLCVQEYLENSPRWRRLDEADKRNIEGWLLDEAHGE